MVLSSSSVRVMSRSAAGLAALKRSSASRKKIASRLPSKRERYRSPVSCRAAGVVGHEIGHVAARHTVQKISRQGPFAAVFGIASGLAGLVVPLAGNIIEGVGDLTQGLLFSPYSRGQETEADQVGQGGGEGRMGPWRLVCLLE